MPDQEAISEIAPSNHCRPQTLGHITSAGRIAPYDLSFFEVTADKQVFRFSGLPPAPLGTMVRIVVELRESES